MCIKVRKCNYSYYFFLKNYNRFKSCKVGVTPNNYVIGKEGIQLVGVFFEKGEKLQN